MKIALSGAAALLFAQPVLASAHNPRVETKQGAIQGANASGVETFLGIPYAQPPIGKLRWRDPVPMPAWSGVRQTVRAAPACYQSPAKPFGPYTSEFLIGPEVSEDCLYLNVWKPAHLRRSAPVLFFIHGGGFGSGSGSIPIYDGSELARRGVVVVTINYRVGVFGFLASPELTSESGRGTSGNYGLSDQIAALRWVHANIAAFGGNPHLVTIAGQSAGAASVNDLIVSPLARGLFQRAIAQSGAGMGVEMPTLALAEQTGQRVLNNAGVNNIEQLRNLSAEAVLSASNFDPPVIGQAAGKNVPPKPGTMPAILFAPNLDGVVLASDPANGAAPPLSDVPLLTGFTSEEAGPPPASDASAAFVAMVRGRYGSFADRLLALYPHGTDAEAALSWTELSRDRYMASMIIWTRARAASSHSPIYNYLFAYPYPGKGWNGTPSAFHTADVPYVFGTVDRSGQPISAQDRAMESAVESIWISFIQFGRPVLKGQVWRAAQSSASDVMTLGTQPGMRAAVSSPARFAAWQEFVAEGGKLTLF